MFVMAVRATFPMFNSGTCADAKNLLQCHSLSGWRERERERIGWKRREPVAMCDLVFSLCASDPLGKISRVMRDACPTPISYFSFSLQR